jgi:hypothetical protein
MRSASTLEQSLYQKYSLYQNQILCHNHFTPRPTEGRIMIVTARWRGLRWTLAASGGIIPARRNAAAYGEIVWSWRRDPGVYPRRPVLAGQRGQERPFPGEITYKPSNHCAGKAGMSWLYLSNPCASFCYPSHTVMRVPPAPGFPCVLCLPEDEKADKPGRIAPRE